MYKTSYKEASPARLRRTLVSAGAPPGEAFASEVFRRVGFHFDFEAYPTGGGLSAPGTSVKGATCYDPRNLRCLAQGTAGAWPHASPAGVRDRAPARCSRSPRASASPMQTPQVGLGHGACGEGAGAGMRRPTPGRTLPMNVLHESHGLPAAILTLASPCPWSPCPWSPISETRHVYGPERSLRIVGYGSGTSRPT